MLSGASGSDSTSAFVCSADEKKRKGVCEHIPMARPGKADEIAAVLTRLDLSTHRGDSSHTEWPQRTVQHHFLRRAWLSTQQVHSLVPQVFAFLASEDASYITGQTLFACGGSVRIARRPKRRVLPE